MHVNAREKLGMFGSHFRSHMVFAALAAILASACGGGECPNGYSKLGKVCQQDDAGTGDRDAGSGEPEAGQDATVVSADGGTEVDATARSDAAPNDAEAASMDASFSVADAGGSDAAPDARGSDASVSDANGTIPDTGSSSAADTGADAIVSCGAGFELKGGTCQDIDECASANSCTVAAYPCAQTIAPGYVCRGQFADWHMPDALAGAKFAPSFDVGTTPGVVIDNVTGLIWQRTIDVGSFTWDGAKNYCDALTWAGQGDWRLPTEVELGSIIDETKSGVSIDIDVFPNTPMTGAFWSSSPYIGSSGNAWAVAGPFWQAFATSSMYRVRCVRSGAPLASAGTPGDRYTVNTANATITDTRTSLIWQSEADSVSYAWDAAKGHCSGLAGWRLPALKELQTLVDLTRGSPSIDPKFANTPTDEFWSASPYLAISDRAWVVNFGSGLSTSEDVTVAKRVRCVR